MSAEPFTVYERIRDAYHNEKGVRLSVDEVEELYVMDEAFRRRADIDAENRERRSSPKDDEHDPVRRW